MPQKHTIANEPQQGGRDGHGPNEDTYISQQNLWWTYAFKDSIKRVRQSYDVPIKLNRKASERRPVIGIDHRKFI